jgi:hypothetical protein
VNNDRNRRMRRLWMPERAVRCGLALLLCLMWAPGILAQDPPEPAARPNRGTGGQGSYAVSDIESVSLTNGNLSLSIPLASLPPIAGGKLSWIVRAQYNSKLWDVKSDERPADLTHGNQPYFIQQLQRSEYEGGWKIGEIYRLEAHNAHQDAQYLGCTGNECLYDIYYKDKIILYTPDGSRHEMRPLTTDIYTGFQAWRRGFYREAASNQTTALYSFDGSYLWARINPSGSQITWAVYMPDGTRVEQYADGIQRIRDANNNG